MDPFISIISFDGGYASYEVRKEDGGVAARLLKATGTQAPPARLTLTGNATPPDRHPVASRLNAILQAQAAMEEMW